MCNVIAAGMSKRATQTRFLGNYKILNTPFLRGAQLLEEHTICQVVSKNRKLLLWKLSKRPIRLRQIPMAENAAYQCMENGGGKHAHIDMFVAHCACRVQCWDKGKDLDGSLENVLGMFPPTILHTLKCFYGLFPAIYYRSTLNDHIVFVIGVWY